MGVIEVPGAPIKRTPSLLNKLTTFGNDSPVHTTGDISSVTLHKPQAIDTTHVKHDHF